MTLRLRGAASKIGLEFSDSRSSLGITTNDVVEAAKAHVRKRKGQVIASVSNADAAQFEYQLTPFSIGIVPTARFSTEVVGESIHATVSMNLAPTLLYIGAISILTGHFVLQNVLAGLGLGVLAALLSALDTTVRLNGILSAALNVPRDADAPGVRSPKAT